MDYVINLIKRGFLESRAVTSILPSTLRLMSMSRFFSSSLCFSKFDSKYFFPEPRMYLFSEESHACFQPYSLRPRRICFLFLMSSQFKHSSNDKCPMKIWTRYFDSMLIPCYPTLTHNTHFALSGLSPTLGFDGEQGLFNSFVCLLTHHDTLMLPKQVLDKSSLTKCNHFKENVS